MEFHEIKHVISNIKMHELNNNQKAWLVLLILCGTSSLWSWVLAKAVFSICMVIYCIMIAGGVFNKKDE